MKEKEIIHSVPGRKDVIARLKSHTDDNGEVINKIEYSLDPKRYTPIEIDGKLAYVDNFTSIAFIWDDFKDALEKAELPFVHTSPKESNYCEYLKYRKDKIMAQWDEYPSLGSIDRPVEEILQELGEKETYIAILYVDLENSTEISSTLETKLYEKILKIFLSEMAIVIDNFKGYVLKFDGDCVIGIFPAEGNFPNTCDNSVQAAIIMISIIEDVINPIFAEKGLQKIGVHIGLDIGSVKAARFGAVGIASVDDLIGYPMSLTAKIQKIADHNEILLGRRLFELIHCSYQEYCEKVNLGEEWTMKDPLYNKTYEVYRCKAKWICRCEDE